jgi:hypothetical protein
MNNTDCVITDCVIVSSYCTWKCNVSVAVRFTIIFGKVKKAIAIAQQNDINFFYERYLKQQQSLSVKQDLGLTQADIELPK